MINIKVPHICTTALTTLLNGFCCLIEHSHETNWSCPMHRRALLALAAFPSPVLAQARPIAIASFSISAIAARVAGERMEIRVIAGPDVDAPARRFEQATGQLEQGRFSRPVGHQEPTLVRHDRQRDVFEQRMRLIPGEGYRLSTLSAASAMQDIPESGRHRGGVKRRRHTVAPQAGPPDALRRTQGVAGTRVIERLIKHRLGRIDNFSTIVVQ